MSRRDRREYPDEYDKLKFLLIEHDAEQQDEIERLRTTVTRQRELLCKLSEWPEDLPLVTVAELETLKAADAAGGEL
jgi:hypothetical protein